MKLHFVKNLADRREIMMNDHLLARGIRDPAVLRAMLEVPREVFVAEGMEEFAYDDYALPIDEGQTISQPYIVAFMTEQLDPKPTDRILEIRDGRLVQDARNAYGKPFVEAVAADVAAPGD